MLAREVGADQARRAQFGMSTVNPHRNAQDARTRAAEVRAEADEIRSLPTGDAARRIETKRAEKERTQRHAAQGTRQIHDPLDHDAYRGSPRRDGPERGL